MGQRLKKNLSWIFLGNISHAILQFSLNIYVARVLTTNDYGLINYAASLVAFFSSVGTLGFDGIITKKFAEDNQNSGIYLGTAITCRMAFSVVSIVLIQIAVSILNHDNKLLAIVVLCQSFALLFSSLDLLVYWYRFCGEANICAVVRLVAFFLSAIWRILSIAVFHSLIGYVLGVAFETVLYSVFLCLLYIKNKGFDFSFSIIRLIEMLKISYPFIFSSILSTIYAQTDKIMLNTMMNSSAVAIYSVSLTLAGAIVIVPTSLIEAFRPEIMISKIDNETLYYRRLKQLYAVIFWICIAYCMFITVFAKQIILVLYGNKYLGAVPSLSLVVWYTSFSYFGAINNLYMVAEGKTKWTQITTLFGAVTNIILNCCMIPMWGVVGAAGASLITQVMANFILLYFIPELRGDFFLIIQAITLHDVLPDKIKWRIRRD